MNRILAACFALALVPAWSTFAADKDAVEGGAAGAALTKDERRSSSSPPTGADQSPPSSGFEEIYAKLPPPPRIIAVEGARSTTVPRERPGNWKTQQYE